MIYPSNQINFKLNLEMATNIHMPSFSIRNLLLSLTQQRFLKTSSSSSSSDTVLQFLKSHHFTDTHIAKLIKKRPRILHCKLQDNLVPKFDFLVQNGFVGELLPQLIVSNPAVLLSGLDSHLKPSFEFFISILGCNDKAVSAIKRSTRLLTSDWKKTIRPNINFLIKEGLSIDRVVKIISLQPRSIQQKHDRMVFAVYALKDMGLEPKALMFIHALSVIIQLNESTWKAKMEVMKSVGWSEEDVVLVFKRCPFLLACSEEKIRSAMDFLVNTLKLEPESIVKYPTCLMYSIDKRLRPRSNVFKVLESKNLIKGDKKILSMLTMSEKKFLENHVAKYLDRVPDLLGIYGGSSRAEKIDG